VIYVIISQYNKIKYIIKNIKNNKFIKMPKKSIPMNSKMRVSKQCKFSKTYKIESTTTSKEYLELGCEKI
jgi:predicted patatin/cPLA2 family phospholipase